MKGKDVQPTHQNLYGVFSIPVTIATSKKNPKSVVLSDKNGMRGHIDAVSRGNIFPAGWHHAQVFHLFPQQCLWIQFMTPLMMAILFLDQLVNLYVEPISL